MGIAIMSAILLASLLISAATALPAEHSGSLVEPALHEGIQEVSSGACPSGWVDASFVDMGCLFFNSTEALASWDDSATMCQMATPNATLVEILTENQWPSSRWRLSCSRLTKEYITGGQALLTWESTGSGSGRPVCHQLRNSCGLLGILRARTKTTV